MNGPAPSRSASQSDFSGPDAAAGFRLVAPEQVLDAAGIKRALPRGDLSTLPDRVTRFFAKLPDGPRHLTGALPFGRDEADFLFQPDTISFEAPSTDPMASAGKDESNIGPCSVTPQPSVADYRRAVSKALTAIASPDNAADPLRKVVLSRSLTILSTRRLSPQNLMAALGLDPSVTVFSCPLPDGEDGPRLLIGATPELLVSKSGATVVSHPLAGSSRRGGDPAADRQSASALQRSEKDQREHAAVVEAVLDTLAPYCRDLGAPDGTTLRPTASMWHLGTRIVGTLKDRDTPVVALAAALHPTPAVCGLPRDRAAALIPELEGYDRGFYAGAVGWTDAAGDGAWYVSIRSAELSGRRIRLYAGAGIVAGSDPHAEADETSAKFAAMLGALGIDENGRPLREKAA